ncbi:MAG TPA: NYN domain-containing protein [Thermoanaerobaculia bacterium]|nr:NYN domain-containing protein [Thermoanaerobaculia bacterium]
MERVTFLIDGFNLYHSVESASQALMLNGAGTKWLDIAALCRSYLHLFGRSAELHEIHYFSALAKHLEATKPDVTARHAIYLDCLQDSGVFVELSRFKKKRFRCEKCRANLKRHEEKETDVALAAKLLELFVTDAADWIVLVTGDTDIAPAVRTAKRLFPAKNISFAFPYDRKNEELAQLVSMSFHMSKDAYVKHQLADPYVTQTGRVIPKPPRW